MTIDFLGPGVNEDEPDAQQPEAPAEEEGGCTEGESETGATAEGASTTSARRGDGESETGATAEGASTTSARRGDGDGDGESEAGATAEGGSTASATAESGSETSARGRGGERDTSGDSENETSATREGGTTISARRGDSESETCAIAEGGSTPNAKRGGTESQTSATGEGSRSTTSANGEGGGETSANRAGGQSTTSAKREGGKSKNSAKREGGKSKARAEGGQRRRAKRIRRAATIAAVVLLVGAMGGWVSAKVRLGATQNRLDDTRADLADRRDVLADAVAREAETQASIDRVQGAIDIAVADRAQLEAMVADLQTQIAAVDAQAAQTSAAQGLVDANSADARTCFAGVSSAVDANRADNDQASVTALREAAAACSRTLAYATGARFPFDFADPFVFRVGGTYYGYSTNAGAGDIQVIRSNDLITWEIVGNGLAGVPGWAREGSTWAPSVLPRNGGYVVYYTVKDRFTGLQCISRGVASSPEGPFRDDSAGPLMCQPELGGSIDPSPFVDSDGRAYLLWKAEGGGEPPQTIWSQELTADGLALTGWPHPLISADRSFERGVVEAPSMVQQGGSYFLIYAAADWNSRQYVTAYATCSGPAGPCSKPSNGRLLGSGSRLAGPGGAEVFRDGDGGLWVAFHAFSEPNVGYPSSRYLHVARLRVSGGGLSIEAST